MKTFEYIEKDALPQLSWCAVIKNNSKVATVYHGSKIETKKEGFVEGAWDCDFDDFNFDRATFFIGSGGKINEHNQFIFSTPSHILERIYSIETSDELYLSNSMPLIIALSDSELLNDYYDYEVDLCSIIDGLKHYKRQTPLANNRHLSIHYYCNIKLDDTLSIVEQPKPEIQPFKNFNHYYTRLSNSLKKIRSNVTDPKRNYHYGMVTTISRGYDSTACSVLAKDLGCDIALTFNAPERHAEDSGKTIAQKLNYGTIIERDAFDFLDNEDLFEAEFVSTGELGSSIVFTAFEEEFKDNIVFVGEGGDFFWDKNARANSDFSFFGETYSQTSFIDNRLRVGYLILPVPFYGAIQWESLKEVSNMEELSSYSVGGLYDRPIARKIIEDAGVERELFGFKDIGVGINYRFDNFNRLKTRMSPKSFNHYRQFYKQHKSHNLHVLGRWIHFLWGMRKVYLDYFLHKTSLKKHYEFDLDIIPNPGAPSHLIHWGVSTHVSQIKEGLKP